MLGSATGSAFGSNFGSGFGSGFGGSGGAPSGRSAKKGLGDGGAEGEGPASRGDIPVVRPPGSSKGEFGMGLLRWFLTSVPMEAAGVMADEDVVPRMLCTSDQYRPSLLRSYIFMYIESQMYVCLRC